MSRFAQHTGAAITDAFFRMRPPARGGALDRIALLEIDDATVARYGPLPLRRSVLAAALAKIEPRVVALGPCSSPNRATTPRSPKRCAARVRSASPRR